MGKSTETEKGKTTKIRCPIHGFIELDELETEIINHRIFQRLKRIKQLALTDMVYPSATHTRFEHSLGVMYMATEMLNSLASDEQNLEKLGLTVDNVTRVRKIVRLAALLHDVGHPCFAHAGEKMMPFLPKNKKKQYKHETYSVKAIRVFFKSIIEGNAYGITVDEVCYLIGEDIKPPKYLIALKGLISSQMDADRADYLLRDSYHLGVRYGEYDKERFIRCITVGKTEGNSAILAIKESGLQMAEHMVMARYSMFSSVYFHKVRRAYDCHAERALKDVLKASGLKDGLFPPPSDDPIKLNEYFKFDDYSVISAMAKGDGGVHGDIIIDRNHYKEKRPSPWKIRDEKNDRKKFDSDTRKLKKKHSDYFIDEGAVTDYYKSKDREKEIHILRGDGITVPLSEISDMITKIGQPKNNKVLCPLGRE
ncbi:MAG: HD domain-containing protein [Defluviitaleaceae bacterium]|nr:HD domain-containing protein [Defluviitaleaceae bacterium]